MTTTETTSRPEGGARAGGDTGGWWEHDDAPEGSARCECCGEVVAPDLLVAGEDAHAYCPRCADEPTGSGPCRPAPASGGARARASVRCGECDRPIEGHPVCRSTWWETVPYHTGLAETVVDGLAVCRACAGARTGGSTGRVPCAPGYYDVLRATGEYRRRDDDPWWDGDLCRHPERPRALLRVRQAGAAARALPCVRVGPACARCEDEWRERAAADDGGPVWQNDPLPVLSVEVIA